MEQEAKKQFDIDKKSAIDEGYTEEQAIQYAQQEQQLRQNKKEQVDNKNLKEAKER